MKESITPELMEKAKTAGSPEELLTLAKESGVELTAEEARAYYAQLHKNGELADDELDAVSGGSGCRGLSPFDSEGRPVIQVACDDFECVACGEGRGVHYYSGLSNGCSKKAECTDCKYALREGIKSYCDHPGHRNKLQKV